MITPIIFGILYTILLIRSAGQPPAGRGEAPEWFMQGFRDLLVYADAGIALFVGWSLVGRLATIGFSQEGRTFWILKTAPVSAGRLLASKFLVAFLPATALGWIFLLALSIARRVAFEQAAFSLIAVAACFAAATGVNLTFGVAGATFDWQDPRHMLRGGSGCLAVLASVLVIAICLLFFFGPILGAAFLDLPRAAGLLAGLLLGGLAGAAGTLIPLRIVRSRVLRLADV
jgi:ABC-2 type transport system permease protein